MAIWAENAMLTGATIGCLDGGGMIVDWDSGEYVPAEQAIIDPLHIDKLDFLAEDHLGPLKATMEDPNNDEENYYGNTDE